jgi:ribosomal-protein-alanine N-acetyltransferase
MKNNYNEILYSNETIKCGRLKLRKFKKSDAAAMLEYGSDPEVLKYLNWEGVHSIESAVSNIVNFCWSRPGIYAIEELASKKCIGCMELRIQPEHERAAFSYIMSKNYWGKGYMTEALSAVLELCFNSLGLNRVEASYSIGNDGSGRVMVKCGMELEGVSKAQLKIKGEFRDIAHYGITKEQFLSLKG